MPKQFDWFDLMKAITYAHVSASTSPALGAEPTTLADEGEAPASPSFEDSCGGVEGHADDPNAEAFIERRVGPVPINSRSGDKGERGETASVSDETVWNRNSENQASPTGISLTISPLHVVMLSGDYFPYQHAVDEALAEMERRTWTSIASKLPDLPLEEQHRLEELDAERESLDWDGAHLRAHFGNAGER